MNGFILALVICAVGIPHALVKGDAPSAEAVRGGEKRPTVPETTQHQLGVNVHDTPEVAAAKTAHFEAVRAAEVATAVANATRRHQPDVRSPSGSHHSAVDHHQSVHHQSSAHHQTPVHHHHQTSVHYPTSAHYPTHGHNTYPVHHTGSAHYPSHVHHTTPVYRPEYAHHTYPSHHQYYVTDYHHYPYSAPVVQTTQHKLGVNVQDTPEVSAAKVAHFEAVRKAAQAAIASNPNDNGLYVNEAGVPVVPVAQVIAPEFGTQFADYSGQYLQEIIYTPVIYNSNGVVAVPQTNQHKLGENVHDTPEVAAAKAAHLAAFRQAELAAAQEDEIKSGSNKNVYANSARQYGQVN